MRRALAILVVAALCGTAFSLGALLGPPAAPSAAWERPASVSWLALAASPALAQEVMQFKPVPPESVSALEGPRERRRTTAPAVPAVPAVPVDPAVPSVPDVPAVPPFPTERSGDVVRFGSDITIAEGQVVVGDVVAMGGDVTVHGTVRGEVVAIGGDVSLSSTGRVDGQVVTVGGQLHEAPGSHVGGQRVTAGHLPRGWSPGSFFGFLGMVDSGLKAAWTISKMLILLLIAWAFTQLAPQRTRTALDEFRREPLKCVAFGVLAWVLIIPSIVALVLVFAILCITIIGIPLAIALLLGYVLALALLACWGYIVGAALLGERLGRQLGRPVATLTLMAVWGIVALTTVRVVGILFGALPMGGGAGGLLIALAVVASGALTTIGAGALLRTQLRRDNLRQWWPGPRTAPAGGAATASPPPPPPSPSPAPASPLPFADPQGPPPPSGP